MIKIGKKTNISLVKQKNISKEKNKPKNRRTISSAFRPQVVDAKVYKVKSAFVKNSVFITLSYIDSDNGRKPIEIFINSKDLNRAPEYVVLTRLISAIFRRATDPMFILEELHGIHDPNGGSFKGGKYYHSFYAEVAETIEIFFYDVGIIDKNKKLKNGSSNLETEKDEVKVNTPSDLSIDPPISNTFNAEFKICPDCSSKSLKTENGCDMCVECGYSKCDK
jgi:ribonucleoside-diphosphate reductase alpha chain